MGEDSVVSPIDRGLDELLAPLGELPHDLVAIGGGVQQNDLSIHLPDPDLLDLLVPHGQGELVQRVQHPVEHGLGPEEVGKLVHESRKEPGKATVEFWIVQDGVQLRTGRRASGSACWGC